jgi:xylulokinase
MLMYGSTLFFIQICSRLPESRLQWPTIYLEPDSYALAAGMSTTGALTKWFRDSFAPQEREAERGGGINAYQALAQAASRVPRGSAGLLVLPYFSGERTPVNDPGARGMIAGLTLSHDRAHIFRAILEGIAFGIRHNLEAMEEVGAPPRRLVAIGGGVQNRLWLQIVSDVTGREQDARTSPGACYGDAMMAAVSVGIMRRLNETRRWLAPGAAVHPDPEASAFYAARYAMYRELYERTRELMHRLGSGGTAR